jgi:hypothetical protein
MHTVLVPRIGFPGARRVLFSGHTIAGLQAAARAALYFVPPGPWRRHEQMTSA